MSCVSITGAPVTRYGSHPRHRSQTRTYVSGGKAGEVAGEIEPGWASPLVSKECCAVRELVLAYHDVLALESNELGCTSAIEHEIRIENSEPFKEQFRCIPPPLLEEVWTSLWDMLEAGAIHPSQSPWCNVVVLVRKKDGTLCFCVDFRCLNARIKKDLYPLPCIQEVLESMVGSAHLSSMDFKSGFWQIKMAPESQQYIAFMVDNLRIYELTHMPFGLCNAPATFQHLMQNTLGELNLTYCVIYLDDVIIFGRTEEEHLEHLHVVFERFQEFNLKPKPSKCSFSHRRSSTWLTMSHNRASCQAATTCELWRNSRCQRPTCRSVHSVD